MHMSLDFEKDLKRMERELGELGKKAIPRAANSAINKTAKQAHRQAADSLFDEVGKASGLSKSGFKRSIMLHRSTVRTLRASLIATGKAIPLYYFGASKGAKGVRASAWNKKKTYKSTFIAKMKNGKRGVFKRTGKKRLPIKQLYGPSLAKEFAGDRIIKSLKRTAGMNWPKNFDHEIQYYLRKFNGRSS